MKTKGARTGRRGIALLLSLLMVLGMWSPTETAYAEKSAGVAADVVFVIDSTGSMSDEIGNVREEITDFVSRLVEEGIDLRIGVLEYRDTTCDGKDSTIIHTLNGSPWHYTVDDIQTTLGKIDADGGGDLPETLIDALGYITKGGMKFRSGARKFAIVLTDASYKLENRHGYKSMDEVLDQLQTMAVSTSVITYSEYYDNSWDEGDDSGSYYDATISSKRGASGSGCETLETSVNPGYEKEKKADSQSKGAKSSATRSGSDDLGTLSEKLMSTAQKISVGNLTAEIGIDGYQIFSFTPPQNGIYTITSESDLDTYGYLYRYDGEQLYSNDDGGTNYNFRIRALMTGGATYYYAVRFYSEGEGSIPISLSYAPDPSSMSSCSYRALAEGTNGILADISGDFSSILLNMAQQILDISFKSKKAIYILPGYMGSRLYSDSGQEVWVDSDFLKEDVKKYAVPFGETTIFMMDSDGGGSKVEANLQKDKYGTQDTYKTLIKELQNKCGDEYDVVFFGYNWLGDLSDSAKRLEKHIEANDYDKVVLVTHSTGGLLAANFIARSTANKKKVEKAILIAAPLYGTYTSLQPIETGKTKDLDSMLEDNGIEAGFLGVQHAIVHNWVKDVTKNSPTTYQLLPTEEYLKTTAVIYETDLSNPVTTKEEYYRVLNGSSNINSNLTNGNSRSHDYFRTTILGGDIIKVLKSVNTYLVGSLYGNDTPALAVYSEKLLGGTKLSDIIYKKDGDGTVMGISASAQRKSGKIELTFKNYDYTQHTELVSDSGVLEYVSGTINGSAAKADRGETAPAERSEGMSSYVKFNIYSNQEVIPYVLDPDGNVVDVTRSDAEGTIYTVLNEEEGDFGSLLYLPLSGWTFMLRPSDENAEGVAGTIIVSTLDEDGYRSASSEYTFGDADENGNLIVFDMSETTVTADDLNALAENQTGSDVDQIETEWEIPENLALSAPGETAQIELTGNAVSGNNVGPGALTWTSADESIAVVDETGTVTATGYGTTTVTAMQNGSNKAMTCEICVRQYAAAVTIGDVEMEAEERYPITPVFEPANVTEREMTYQIDEEGIIEIEDDVIIALADGTVEVQATAAGGAATTFTVTVKTNKYYPVESVEVAEKEVALEPEDQKVLSAQVMPENATDKSIEWVSEDETKIAVEDKGDGTCVITALRPGICRVFAVSGDGGFSTAVKVTVTGELQDSVYMQEDYSYTGQEIIPAIEVYWNEYMLEEGEDYTLTVRNNVEIGTGTVLIEGMGAYTGSLTKEFNIHPGYPEWDYWSDDYYQKVVGDPAFELYVKLVTGDGALSYQSTDETVATVDASGKVTIVGPGSCDIVVTSEETQHYYSSSWYVYIYVSEKPTVIETQPMDVTVAEGEKATFKVTASGKDLNYQWYYRKGDSGEWTAVSAASGKKAAYSLTTAARHNGYQYYCEVTGAGGTAESEVVTLTVLSKPTITTQPKSVTVKAGEKATMKVVAKGAETYQWYYRTSSSASWKAVSSSNGKKAAYTLTTAAKHNGYQYRCKVSNQAGHVYSSVVTLKVLVKPTITTQPESATVKTGTKVTMKVVAEGAKTYQWYYRTSSSASWKAVSASSGKTAAYTLKTADKHNGYQYRCKVSNDAGDAYSSAATLTVVTAKPTITTQPANKTVSAGTKVNFKVTAKGTALSYQWYYRTSSSGTWKKVTADSGKKATYTLTAAARHNGYQYKCVVKNLMGSVTSKIVTLKVTG